MAGFFLKKFVEFWNFTEQETTKKKKTPKNNLPNLWKTEQFFIAFQCWEDSDWPSGPTKGWDPEEHTGSEEESDVSWALKKLQSRTYVIS